MCQNSLPSGVGSLLGAKISGEGVAPGEYFLVSTKLDTFCYPTVQTAPCYVPSFWHNTGVWRTDRQTDGIAVASTALAIRALRRAVKTGEVPPKALTSLMYTRPRAESNSCSVKSVEAKAEYCVRSRERRRLYNDVKQFLWYFASTAIMSDVASLAKSLLPANARAHSLTVWSTPKVSTLWPLWSPNGWSQKKQTSNCLWLPALGIPESRSALVHRRLLGTSSLDSPNSLLSSVLRHAVSKCSSFTLQLSWTELVVATLVPLYRILYKSCQQSITFINTWQHKRWR